MRKGLLLLLVVGLAVGLRGYRLGEIPAGLYVDEAVLGYNAYSLLLTGREEYGRAWPVFLRSFGTFPAVGYAYATVPAVKALGLTTVGVRMAAVVAGVGLVAVCAAYFGMGMGWVVALAPGLVFFSRAAFEANLALAVFMAGFVMCLRAQAKKGWLMPGLAFLSLSAWIYHAERFLGGFFVMYFAIYYWRRWKRWRGMAVGLGLALVIQAPLLVVSLQPGVNSRVTELVHGGGMGKKALETLRYGAAYWSPNNLFSRPDPDAQRSWPELGVFYWWMAPLWLVGGVQLWRSRGKWGVEERSMAILVVVAVLPGAVTRDYFSSLRVLPFLVAMAWVVGVGWKTVVGKRWWLAGILVGMGMVGWYGNLVLLEHERDVTWGYPYKVLFSRLEAKGEKPVVVDNSRLKPIYILAAVLERTDPRELQAQAQRRLAGREYYSEEKFEESPIIGRMFFRPIEWDRDVFVRQILVGDKLAISQEQAREHELRLRRTIKGVDGEEELWVYETDPQAKCRRAVEIDGEVTGQCRGIEL